MVSKAAERSSTARTDISPRSEALKSLVNFRRVVSVLWCSQYADCTGESSLL